MIFALFLPFIAGYLSIRFLLPEIKNIILICSCSFCLGVSICSIITFLLLILFGNNYGNILIPVILFIVILFLLIILKKQNKKIIDFKYEKSENKFLFVLFLLVFFISIFQMGLHFYKEPYGSWDGVFIWNFHSKFLYSLYLNAIDWKYFFNDAISWSHIDYPLLYPLYNYACFVINGTYNPLIPIINSFCFSMSALFLLIASVKEFVNEKNALLAGIVLLTSKAFVWEGSSQCCDIVLSFYILSSFVFLLLSKKYNNNNFVIFSFFFAASAAFSKNEGILFLILFFLLYLILLKERINKFVCLGLFFPLFCVLYSKLFLYGQSDLFENQTAGAIISDVLNPDRIKTILMHYVVNIQNIFNLVLISIFAIMTGKRSDSQYKKYKIFILIVILLIFIAYFLIYLITPNNLNWHLVSSSMRLLVQYIPLLIFFLFISFNCAE